jgi:histidinol-phosphatase
MPTTPLPTADLELALAMADAADGLTAASFRKAGLRVDTKPDRTPVTEADQACERLLRDLLAQHRPADAIVGEEFGAQDRSSARQWILDPIDGTANYLRGVPVWCTLIALVADDEPTVGVVSAPALGRRWWAARGCGAFTRDPDGSTRAISVSAVADLEHASFSYSDRAGWRERGAADGLDMLQARCWRTRAYGDFWSHMLVAEGAVDVSAEPFLAAWDMAALLPVLLEAGARATGYDGGRPLAHGSLVATNGLLHDEVLALLRG